MELNEGQFNILLDILYFLREKDGGQLRDSDFYFTYGSVGQERLKLYNVDSDKISLEFKGFKDIDCSQLDINEVTEGDVDNVIDGIGIIEGAINRSAIDEIKDKVKNKVKRLSDDNFYSKIKRLIFSFKGKEDMTGTDIKEAEYFEVNGSLGDIFSDFDAAGDKRLELELSGFCKIKSDIDKSNFKIKGKFNPNSQMNDNPIGIITKKDKKDKKTEDSQKGEELNVDDAMDYIFEKKNDLLTGLFDELRRENKVELREGKEPKIIPGFNDIVNIYFENNRRNFLEGYGEYQEMNSFIITFREQLKSGFRKRFRKEIKRAYKEGGKYELFGKEWEYKKEENIKNEIKGLKGLSKECKRLMFDNKDDKDIKAMIDTENKNEKEIKEKIYKKIKEKLKSDYEIKSIDREVKHIKKGIEKINNAEKKGVFEKKLKAIVNVLNLFKIIKE